MKTPEITFFDDKGGRFAIFWQPRLGSPAIWWTGSSMTSASLKPRIKYFETKQEAEADLPSAIATANRSLSAQY